MDKYSTSLSSMTGGRGFYSMSFYGYEKVPYDVQEELIKSFENEFAEH